MMNRRPFLRLGALAGAGLGFPLHRSSAAEEPAEVPYARFVPHHKGHAADWLASLTTRGHTLDTAIRHSKADSNLDVIGMTAGGIGCGTVYLSGVGRLWVWDTFNQHHEGVGPNNKAQAPTGLQTIQCREPKATLSTTHEVYERNLEKLVARLKATGATLVWASTTVVPDGEAGRFVGDDAKSARVMVRHQIPINDLHTTSKAFAPAMFVKPGDVHFNAEGSAKLAAQVAEVISANLKPPSGRETDPG